MSRFHIAVMRLKKGDLKDLDFGQPLTDAAATLALYQLAGVREGLNGDRMSCGA